MAPGEAADDSEAAKDEVGAAKKPADGKAGDPPTLGQAPVSNALQFLRTVDVLLALESGRRIRDSSIPTSISYFRRGSPAAGQT